MSLNLTLNKGKNGPEIPLWQTPTWVTLICLSHNPETNEFDGGHNGVRSRYIKWVESHANKDREKIKDHIKLINSIKKPYFSYI